MKQGMGRRMYISLIISLAFMISTIGLTACSSKKSTGGISTSGMSTENSKNMSSNINILLSDASSAWAIQYTDDDMYTKELSRLSGYNLKYEFLSAADYNQQLTVRFESKNLPDVLSTVSISSEAHPGAVEKNMFTPLNDLLDTYGPNIKKNIPKEIWDSPRVSKNGQIYGIPVLGGAPAIQVVYIRQDWLDKLNMPQPKTIDDYLKFFEAVKVEDMNGNGDPNDEYGFYVRENLEYSELFFKEFGVHPREWVMRDGKLQPGFIQPEIKDALRFWKMLYDKGYINPDLFTNKMSDWRAGIKEGKAGMWVHDVPNYASDWGAESFVNEKNVKLSMLGAIEGPKGKGLTVQDDHIMFVWVIPTSNIKPENVIKFLDWAWSDEKADQFFAYGIEGTDYTVENGKIIYDSTNKQNVEMNINEAFRIMLNPRQDGRLLPLVLNLDPNAEQLKQGLKVAEQSIFTSDGFGMPTLEASKSRPELAGFGAGSLFLDMFAKILSGKVEDIDSTFDAFTKEWKIRGGDEIVGEATSWYKHFHRNP
ncbi:extracellular solute-binding protein [Paenibacillus eucommiae]|uniref:Aldouronate transport system substrate-binding protein n=1 Tax=Paenibacillus eucommiae TaxID=1355755 RepID=A0ABS4IZU2_9BACL|nr:extracellular solute-binding protein [Paenibacillus eucommiae]MBP1993099.1 putative aldouronate transport system substrate-binding protein [Paenibacillus eucommiae]